MSRPESREIYQIAKMHMNLTPALSRDQARFSHVYYEYSSAFDVEFMIGMPLHVLSVAKYRSEGGFRYSTGALDVYDLLVIYSGGLEYACKDKTITAGKGDALYINAALPGEVLQKGDEPLEFLILTLSGISALNYYALLSKKRSEPIPLHEPEKIDALLEKIVYYMKYPTNKNNVLLVDAMSGIFTELYLNISGDADRDTYYNHPQWFISTIGYIESRSLSGISVQKLAENLGMSDSRFYRVFREYTGTTPYQYLLNLRVKAAQNLLATTDHQIKYIAYTVGFNSVNHFITHFKEAAGCTPSEYRAMRRNRSE
ncbi:MAG: helix-turn-helix transcriptional regulator [Clostridia bacterium]|nr:helix-turn-helix transcriptional regulator [Clostridia bacterium]